MMMMMMMMMMMIAPAIILIFIAIPSLRLLYLIDEINSPVVDDMKANHERVFNLVFLLCIKCNRLIKRKMKVVCGALATRPPQHHNHD